MNSFCFNHIHPNLPINSQTKPVTGPVDSDLFTTNQSNLRLKEKNPTSVGLDVYAVNHLMIFIQLDVIRLILK